MDRIEFIGNLTRDPELRTTQTGVNVCSFSVAVNKPLTKAQKDAGQQPQAKYYRVSAWRELGENCAKYLAKGRKVYVSGTVDVSTYVSNQDGKTYANLEVTANEVEFLSPRDANGAAPAAGQGNAAPAYQAPAAAAPAAPAAPAGFTAVETDELPF